MKKKNTFNKPEVEIIKFTNDDVIAESWEFGPTDPPEQPSGGEGNN